MSLEPIGIIAFAIGIFCLLRGNGPSVIAMSIASVLGAAAAMLIGSANIQPGHVLLGFLVIGVATRPAEARAAVRALRPGSPGFWYAVLVIYSVMSAYFAPRLLAGITRIIPLGSTIYGDTHSPVPLVPGSSNLTQSVYMIGNLICFVVVVAVGSTPKGFKAILNAIIAYCIANTVFAILDVVTFSTGTGFILGFIRNAQYVLHVDDQVGGSKRIVGSFPEASTFARSTLGVFGFVATLWLCGRRPYLNAFLAVSSFALLVLSTSSTGLAGAPVLLIVLYLTALRLAGRPSLRKFTATVIVFVPLAGMAILLWIATDPQLLKFFYDYADLVVLGKGSTSSGIERNNWNVVAMQNVFDTFGLGTGLGTVRTSSFAVALLANVGIPGTIAYLCFAYGALLKRRGTLGSLSSDIQLAARNGCIGLLLGDLLVASAIDQGLFFCLLAAIATAEPGGEELPQPSPRPIQGAMA
ncbi:hypothetical protein [Rhizobium tumorigenes]|uniref:hypothetical protein n=1 Tax=Rhizobium tumorigenes TaxID=2041385 RepID=UPI00241EC174|nr:hypothetical protein [Rhizobium tumorigenes]WFS03318.1 hypothetical protein PR016_22050 [Rhizobium tumorigenes]